MVEDDPQVRAMFGPPLAQAGFQVLLADSVSSGLEQFRFKEPDLILLDVNLPDGTGFDVCRQVRASKKRPLTPIIMMTARSGVEDKEEGFGAGADQYLVKPVSPSELLLWCRALLRRLEYDAGAGAVLRAGEMTLDPSRHAVRIGERAVLPLTLKEFELLYFLVKSQPKALSRRQILSQLWDTITEESVVDAHVGKLRRKLPPDIAECIYTVQGLGYRFFMG